MSVRRVSSGGDQLAVALKSLDGLIAKTGIFETSKYTDKDATPVAYVAAIQEYGYPGGGIPARPTWRPTIEQQTPAWRETMRLEAKDVLNGKRTAAEGLGRLAAKAAGDVQASIAALTSPPLKPATIAARYRGRKDKPSVTGSKPLVDTGQMLRSVTYVVEPGGGS